MAPQVVLDLVAAVSLRLGPAEAERLCEEAQIIRLPGPTEPLREDKAARLHQALRRLHPEEAPAILREAGEATAESLVQQQQSQRAQAMLAGAPWPIAAWLLGRWARQHAWTFAGSGAFSILNALEYEIADNPLLRGTALSPCHWHIALFQRMFQRLVDPELECREIACAGAGAPACRFVFALR
jgi:divinyl protochlorophyllide a 8-vinyl-reductase